MNAPEPGPSFAGEVAGSLLIVVLSGLLAVGAVIAIEGLVAALTALAE